LARSSSSSLTLLATACKPPTGYHHHDIGRQHDDIGRQLDDIGRQHE